MQDWTGVKVDASWIRGPSLVLGLAHSGTSGKQGHELGIQEQGASEVLAGAREQGTSEAQGCSFDGRER